MKEKQRILLIAIIISTIITGIITGLILINTRQTDPTLPQPQAFLMEGIVKGVLGDQPYVPYWQLGLISVICFVVFALIFYFVLGKLKNQKLDLFTQ